MEETNTQTGKSKPINFSVDMVQSILDGRKTQTRRPIKPQPIQDLNVKSRSYEDVLLDGFKPFCQKGDVLWVREAFNVFPVDENGDAWSPYKSLQKEMPKPLLWGAVYAADDNSDGPFRPSIHMPRWASRIGLLVTDVNVERLQDISVDDAIREGIEIYDPRSWEISQERYRDYLKVSDGVSLLNSFRTSWDSIYYKNYLGWIRNPWVWVISFEK